MNHVVDSLMTSPHACTMRGAISTSGPSSVSLWNTASSLFQNLATNAAVLAALVLSPVKGFFGHLQGVPDFMDNSPAIKRRSVRNWGVKDQLRTPEERVGKLEEEPHRAPLPTGPSQQIKGRL